jgi:CBS domain-containing protein
MDTVQDLLQQKGTNVYTIDHARTVYDAVTAMTIHNVGALVVTHGQESDKKICGIITERDYLHHIVQKGRSSRTTPVSDIMTRKVVYTEPERSVEEVLIIMTEQRFRHLPVMQEDKLHGIVSIGDCVKAIIKRQEVELKYLKEYIADGYPGPGNEVNP